jgi:hypothetical protein
MYFQKPEWSKDDRQTYYTGFEMKVVWPLVRLAALISIFGVVHVLAEQSLSMSIGICLFITLTYQHVIALIMGYTVIPGMDAATFTSNNKINTNVMNVAYYDCPPDSEVVEFNVRKLMKNIPKFTYKITELFGEYYYQPMHLDKTTGCQMTVDRVLKYNQDPNTLLKT